MKAAHIPGIFNDVMGPVMRGPSSSHTAAAHRIGSMIRQAGGPDFSKVSVKFDKSSALATTYLGQGSALGLAGGLLGLEMTDPEIVNYEKHLGNSSFSIEYLITDLENKHPNAYDIHVQYPGREDLHILAISSGGGMIEIVQWNDVSVALKGDFFETLLFYRPVDGQKVFEIENKLNTRLTGFKLYKSQDNDQNLLLNIKYSKNQSKEIEKIAGLIATPYLQYNLQPVMPTPLLPK
ncbi:MAG: hypothetical protein U5Q03_04845 [Bacteroidota bacterium]|nr:hypothetical protein [Bacteroidota bacterium]